MLATQPAAHAVRACACSLVSVLAFARYPFEDAYLTLRYAENLVHGSGFVFQEGEAVLGTSSPLWALILALLLGCGVPGTHVLDVASALSIAALALSGSLWLVSVRAERTAVLFPALIALGFAHLHDYWGMETYAFTAAVFALMTAAQHGRFRTAGVLTGLAFLLRHETLVVGVVLIGWVAAKSGRRPAARVLSFALWTVIPWIAFAFASFGSPIPHTLAAKANGLGFWAYMRDSLNALGAELVPRALTEWTAPITVAVGACAAMGVMRSYKQATTAVPLAAATLGVWLGLAVIGTATLFGWHRAPLLLFSCAIALIGLQPLVGGLRLSLVSAALIALALPLAMGARSELESSHNYLARIGAYDEITAYLNATRLNERCLLTAEPGYIAHRTGVRVIDAAGLVTPSIRFGGRDATQLGELMAAAPDMILARAPFEYAGYATACEAIMGRRLLVRDDLMRTYRTSIGAWRRNGPSMPPLAALHLKIDSPIAHACEAHIGWRELRCEGRPRALSAETKRFRIDCDALAIESAGTHPLHARCQLVIRGQIVVERPASTRLDLPVERWRGQIACVRILLLTGAGDSVQFGSVRAACDP